MLTLLTKPMKAPCEKIVTELIPSLRAQLVKQLLDDGLKQAEIARKLGITRGAVSQYVKNLRGKKKFSKKTLAKIKRVAKAIEEGKCDGKRIEICCLCSMISDAKCGIHSKVRCGVC